jgi:putative endonuclease
MLVSQTTCLDEYRNTEIARDGFTKKYKVWKLVHFEVTPQIDGAILREKQLKAGSREDKVSLVESTNPYWRDLYHDLRGGVCGRQRLLHLASAMDSQ